MCDSNNNKENHINMIKSDSSNRLTLLLPNDILDILKTYLTYGEHKKLRQVNLTFHDLIYDVSVQLKNR